MPPPQEEEEEVNESVLKDILDELDRERSRRAELEDAVRKLQDEKSVLQDSQRMQDERSRTAESLQVSFHSFIEMETKLEGFQQIVDTITRGKPAIAAAMAAEEESNTTPSLPVHIVRLLEVVPWDPRAQQHIRKEETIIEWQVYRDGAWKGQLALFPPMLRTLRVSASSSSSTEGDNRDLRTFFANVERQAMRKKLDRVLTDASVTLLYETDAGYALPTDYGSWQWAGGWKVQQLQDVQQDSARLLCDDDGWSYAKKPQEFMLQEQAVSDTCGATDDPTTKPPRPFRRRYWTRQRVLVDYPFASEATKQYLKMVAETTSLAFTADKINEQLVETKTTLTETERLLCEARSDATNTTTMSGGVVELKEVGPEMGNDSGRSKTSAETAKTTGTLDLSVGKLTQWVQATRKTSEDMTISDESLEEGSISVGSSHGSVSTDATAPDKFDWKRFSRGTIQKWKTQQQVIRNPHFNIQGNPLFRKITSSDPASHMVDSEDDDEL